MCWRLSLLAVCSLFLLAFAASASAAFAQSGDGPDIFVTPVPNAPFSAVVNIERSFVRPDGDVGEFKSIREIGRDSHGRIHNERRALLPANSAKTPDLLRIHLYDPQTRTSAMLYPHKKTFWTTTVNHPPSTVPPNMIYSAPPGSSSPQNEFTREEDLGVRDIEGISVHGVRELQTIPDEKNLIVTDEYWYSEDLRINLIVKHSDPRSGSVTLTVSQITCAEPDTAFFEIPDNYKQRRGED
jgi:hypothetical protein